MLLSKDILMNFQKLRVLEPVFTLPEYEKWVSDSTT